MNEGRLTLAQWRKLIREPETGLRHKLICIPKASFQSMSMGTSATASCPKWFLSSVAK